MDDREFKPCGHATGDGCMCALVDSDRTFPMRPEPRAYSTPREGLEDAIRQCALAIDEHGFAFYGVDLRNALRTIRACLEGTREAIAKHEVESGALRRDMEEWVSSLPPAPICTDDACKCVECVDGKTHAFKRESETEQGSARKPTTLSQKERTEQNGFHVVCMESLNKRCDAIVEKGAIALQEALEHTDTHPRSSANCAWCRGRGCNHCEAR